YPKSQGQKLSIARLDLNINAVVALNIHLTASKLLIVIRGRILVGFITPNGKLITKILVAGDVFLFPKGLINFQINVDVDISIALLAFNSERPRTIVIGENIFGAAPPVPLAALERSFRANQAIIDAIKAQF
ncbi:putative germin-like protein 2-3, partial [Wolffia australiana]